MDWHLEQDRKPTREDGPMANENKVQVEVLTPSGKRRNYFVAPGQGGFDDFDLLPVKAWRPLPDETSVEPYRSSRRW